MNGWRPWIVVALPVGLLGLLPGCHHCGTQSCYAPAPPVRVAGILPAHPLTPCQSCPISPAPPAVTLNPPTTVRPPVDSGVQPMPPGPAQPGPVQQAWGPPSQPGVSLGAPVPAAPEQPRESARPSVPESPEPPKAGGGAEMPREPESAEKPRRSPALPVGIADFAEVKPDVATGVKPVLDGLDWLKDKGYKTVLQLHTPDEIAAGDDVFRPRGLKYLSLEVSPRTLTPRVVEEFNRIVADPANRPLFVYDKDGSLRGALWYLHFRTADKLPDEEARKRAAAFGLKEDGDGAHREMWLAVQRYLEEQEKK
jgi:hypothetical protein